MDADVCPVCGVALSGGWAAMAAHLVDEAARSEARHVMWLNRTVTKHRTAVPELAALLEDLAGGGAGAGAASRVRR